MLFAMGGFSELVFKLLKRQSPLARYRLHSALGYRTFKSECAALLGWQPRVGVREGIRREIESSAPSSAAGRGQPAEPQVPPVPDDRLPRLSLLIAAFNEEKVIEGRVLNALAMDYPADRLEIVVASDGSADRTAELVNKYADRGVRMFDYKQRRGKTTVLNST